MSLVISDHERAALAELEHFPLFAAMTGRRSRRFPVGGRIPAGALAYTSRRPVQPLSEVERALLISASGGVTGWNFGITHNPSYAPRFPQLLRQRDGPDLPVGGRLPHQPAVLHRRHRNLSVAQPRRASPRVRQHRGVDQSHRGVLRAHFGHSPRTASRGTAHGRSQHLDRQPSGQPAGLPGRRSRRAPDGKPVVLRGQRLSDRR